MVSSLVKLNACVASLNIATIWALEKSGAKTASAETIHTKAFENKLSCAPIAAPFAVMLTSAPSQTVLVVAVSVPALSVFSRITNG